MTHPDGTPTDEWAVRYAADEAGRPFVRRLIPALGRERDALREEMYFLFPPVVMIDRPGRPSPSSQEGP